jgi:hypothetical protein
VGDITNCMAVSATCYGDIALRYQLAHIVTRGDVRRNTAVCDVGVVTTVVLVLSLMHMHVLMHVVVMLSVSHQ